MWPNSRKIHPQILFATWFILSVTILWQPVLAQIDVGVVEVLTPRGIIRNMSQILPRVFLQNFSGVPVETCRVFLEIEEADYSDTVIISLPASVPIVPVEFRPWIATPPDEYEGAAWIVLPGDTNPDNDLLEFEFVVADTGYFFQVESLPPGVNPKKRVKSGGSLVRGYRTLVDQLVDTLIFAFKGNNTRAFLAYNVREMNWQFMESIPYALPPNKQKRVKSGAALCYDGGDTIYALKGNNTLEFWAYSVLANSWLQKTDVPIGAGKKVKGGAGLAFVKEDGKKYVYCLKGNKTNEFYKFDIANGNWITTLRPAPGGTKGFGPGSCIVYDSLNQRIYALQGSTNQLFYYDIKGDSWVGRAGMPFDSDILETEGKKAKDGTAMTIDDSITIYALKGGTQEFWSYNITKDSWYEKDTIPLGLARKKVKGGGALVFVAKSSGTKGRGEGEIYALKGNNTNEMYVFLTEAVPPKKESAINSSTRGDKSEFRILNFERAVSNSSGLAPSTIKIYNAAGRLLKQSLLATDHSEHLRNFGSGIYFLFIEGKGFSRSFKLVITR
ncbi:MAG: T9SS type A sorting domain-containing protein [candidate division WOR-3 bacterium]